MLIRTSSYGAEDKKCPVNFFFSWQVLRTDYITTMKQNNQGDFMQHFTDFELIAIENALEQLIDELRESADPEFSVALEEVVFAYDLDEKMEQELIEQYDNLNR